MTIEKETRAKCLQELEELRLAHQITASTICLAQAALEKEETLAGRTVIKRRLRLYWVRLRLLVVAYSSLALRLRTAST